MLINLWQLNAVYMLSIFIIGGLALESYELQKL